MGTIVIGAAAQSRADRHDTEGVDRFPQRRLCFIHEAVEAMMRAAILGALLAAMLPIGPATAATFICAATAADNRVRIEYEVRLHVEDRESLVGLRDRKGEFMGLVGPAECVVRGSILKTLTLLNRGPEVPVSQEAEVFGYGTRSCEGKGANSVIAVLSPQKDPSHPYTLRFDPWKDGKPFALYDTSESPGSAGSAVVGRCR